MFLRDYNKGVCSLLEYKYIVQICMDRLEQHKQSKILHDIGYSSIPESETLPLQSILRFVQEKFNFSSRAISDLSSKVTEYMLSSKRDDLIYEYSKTSHMREHILGHISRTFGVKKATAASVDLIFGDFSEYIRKHSCDAFQFQSERPLAFLKSTFNTFFLQSRGRIVFDEINTSGATQKIAGSTDVSKTDLLDATVENVRELRDFSRIAYNICECSYDIYEHTGEVFYDLFSRYKFNELQNIVHKINDSLSYAFKTNCCFAKIDSYDINSEAHTNYAYRTAIKNTRDAYLSYFDSQTKHGFSSRGLARLFTDLVCENAKYDPKDRKQIFNFTAQKKSRSIRNKTPIEKFFSMVYGYTSLLQLVNHLRLNKISIFNVPSSIFKNEKLLKRFSSLTDYIDSHDDVVRSMEESYARIDGILTNDELYDSLLSSKLKLIGSIKFSSLKTVLEANDITDARELEDNTVLIDLNTVQSYIQIVSDNLMATSTEKSVVDKLVGIISNSGVVLKNDDGVYSSDYRKLPTNIINLMLGLFVSDTVKYNKDSDKSKYIFKPVSKVIEDSGTTEVLLDLLRYQSLKFAILKILFLNLSKLKTVRNKIEFINFCVENETFVNLPSLPASLEEIEYIFREGPVDLYLVKDQFLDSIEDRFLEFYKHIMGTYSEMMSGIRSRRDKIFAELDSNFVTNEVIHNTDTEQLIKFNGYILLSMEQISTPLFNSFKSRCTVDDNGYLVLNGVIHTKVRHGNLCYLHYYGYWVLPNYEQGKIYSIEESDNF